QDLDVRRQQLRDNLHRFCQEGIRFDVTNGVTAEPLFFPAYQGFDERETQADFASLWVPPPDLPLVPSTDSRIRVGIFTSFFKEQTILFLNGGMVAELDRRRFRVILLSPGAPADEVARKIFERADEVVLVPPHLPSARRLIAELRLDV